MPRSYPDWSNVRREVTYILREDLAELAARLGSVNVYDRRGNIVWWDDFGRGMGAWFTATSGTGAAVALSTTYPHWPPFCLALTAGSTGKGYATVIRSLAPLASGRLGAEACVAFPTDWSTFDFFLQVADGTLRYQANITLSLEDQKIYYEDEDSNLVELDDLPDMVSEDGAYHHLKTVANFTDHLWIRFMLDGQSYEIPTVPLQYGTDAGYPHIDLEITLYARSGENDYCLLDGVILTQDER